MTEQPTRPILLGTVHKQHLCGVEPRASICGYVPGDPTRHLAKVPDARLGQYQDCIVCTDLWENARESGLRCGRCREIIRQ